MIFGLLLKKKTKTSNILTEKTKINIDLEW